MPHGLRRLGQWRLPMAFCVFSAGLQTLGEPAILALRLESESVWLEPWRLLTGHWVHLTWHHWLLNMASLGLFISLFPLLLRPVYLLGLGLGASLGVDVGLLWLHPDVAWYVGLSGVLYGLLAGAAVIAWRRDPWLSAIVLVLLGLKLVTDQWVGTPWVTEQLVGGRVIAAAHSYGAAGAVLAAAGYYVLMRFTKRRKQ